MNNHDLITLRKEWQREWSILRTEYLAGKLPTITVAPVTSSPTDGVRWECPECGAYGTPTHSEGRAEAAGEGHANSHTTREDDQALEDLKVQRMPEVLMTYFQRARKEVLDEINEDQGDDK